MLLAIDAGNTNVVFALLDGREIKTRWRIATDPRRTADEYAVWLHQLLELEGYSRSDVDAVIIGTVVPRALHNLEVLATKYFHVEPLIAGTARPPGRSSSTSTSHRMLGPTERSMPLPRMRSIRAISSSSISGRRRPST